MASLDLTTVNPVDVNDASAQLDMNKLLLKGNSFTENYCGAGASQVHIFGAKILTMVEDYYT